MVERDAPRMGSVPVPPDVTKRIETKHLVTSKEANAQQPWRIAESGCNLGRHSTRANVMDDVLQRLREALAGRYTIEREIGRGGMSFVLPIRTLDDLYVLHRIEASQKFPLRGEMLCAQGVGSLMAQQIRPRPRDQNQLNLERRISWASVFSASHEEAVRRRVKR